MASAARSELSFCADVAILKAPRNEKVDFFFRDITAMLIQNRLILCKL